MELAPRADGRVHWHDRLSVTFLRVARTTPGASEPAPPSKA